MYVWVGVSELVFMLARTRGGGVLGGSNSPFGSEQNYLFNWLLVKGVEYVRGYTRTPY